MSVNWYRVESHSSPRGHELRAKARGKTWRTYQAADGTWRVGPVGGSSQQTKTCRTLSDARAYAERGLAANPTSSSPQEIHMSTTALSHVFETNPRRRRRSKQVKEHVACGDLSARKCRQLQHVYTSARKRGYSKTRASKQAWGAVERSRNPMPKAVSDFLATLERTANPRHRRRKGRRRNATAKGHAGLGAFIGSLAGAGAGMAVNSSGLSYLGNVVGAGVGGHIGAASDRKSRGTWGGVIGALILGPIGAGIGGWIGGKRPDAG